MKNDMLYYNVKLKTIGPLFVGNGEMLNKSEYVLDRRTGVLYVMDILKLFNGLKKQNLLYAYENTVMSAMRQVDLFSFFKEYNLLNKYIEWAKYSYKIDIDKDTRNTQIAVCIKDAYLKPYIPGSSLKGAIRNAILNYDIMLNNDKYKECAYMVETEEFKGKKRYLSRVSDRIERVAGFYKSEDYPHILSGLKIGDSKPLSEKDIILCRKYDVFPDGSKKKLPLQRECIKPGTIIEFTMEIDKKIFNYSAEDIYKAITMMYNNIKDTYMYAFKDSSYNLKNLIYVGGGAGYITKTAVYSLFADKSRAVKNAAKILHNVDSNKPKSNIKIGNHLNDPVKYGIAPHTRKCTVYNNQLYDFGLCSIDFQPI